MLEHYCGVNMFIKFQSLLAMCVVFSACTDSEFVGSSARSGKGLSTSDEEQPTTTNADSPPAVDGTIPTNEIGSIESAGETTIKSDVEIGPTPRCDNQLSPVVSGTWSYGANAPGKFHQGLATGNLLVGVKGYTGENNAFVYNMPNNTWQTFSVGQMSPGASFSATSDRILSWGGDFDTSGYVNTGFNFSPVSGDSNPLSKATGLVGVDLTSGRSYHTSVWTGTELLVWGGIGAGSVPGKNHADGASYSPLTGDWTTLPATTATGRSDVPAVS